MIPAANASSLMSFDPTEMPMSPTLLGNVRIQVNGPVNVFQDGLELRMNQLGLRPMSLICQRSATVGLQLSNGNLLHSTR
jgi:hypothetical protein